MLDERLDAFGGVIDVRRRRRPSQRSQRRGIPILQLRGHFEFESRAGVRRIEWADHGRALRVEGDARVERRGLGVNLGAVALRRECAALRSVGGDSVDAVEAFDYGKGWRVNTRRRNELQTTADMRTGRETRASSRLARRLNTVKLTIGIIGCIDDEELDELLWRGVLNGRQPYIAAKKTTVDRWRVCGSDGSDGVHDTYSYDRLSFEAPTRSWT